MGETRPILTRFPVDDSGAMGSSWRDLAWPLTVYALAILPFCATFLLLYPDERFYLDASLSMHQTGDLMVPRFDDGSPRLNKPVLTYWIMLASYRAFGVHLLAARLPFFLAGAGVLFLTYRLGLLLSAHRQIARLALWIMLTNPLFWLSCMRCLPDILVTLFALMTVFGYFALRTRQGSGAVAGWLLFGGLGLAVACKGLPGLLLMGCLGLHAFWHWRQEPIAWNAKPIAPLVGGVLIGLAGYLPILWYHPDETAAEMWRDQFAARLIGKTWGNVYRLPLLLLSLVGLFLPWLLPCVLQWGRGILRIRRCTAWERFLALTGILWLGATAATENCSVRYVFPLFPWLAVTLATAISVCDVALIERYSRRLLSIVAGIVFCVLLLASIIVLEVAPRPWMIGGIGMIGVGVIAAHHWGRRQNAWGRLTVAEALCLATLPAIFLAASSLLLPDLGTQAQQSLAAVPGAKDAVEVMGSACQASRVRLALAPQQATVQHTNEAKPGTPVVLMAQSQAERLAAPGVDFYPAAHLLERLSWRDAVSAACRGQLETFLQAQATPYCWAVCKGGAAH